MSFKHLALPLLSLLLISCGGGGSDSSKEPPPPSATPPVVTLSVDSASIDEGSTVVITHSAKDYQGTTITSELSCDVGTLDGNNYTSPNIIEDTTATCTATATDSGNRSTTETLTLTINVLIYPPVISLNVDSTSIDESSTVVITHSAKDYQDTAITSELSCDVGTLDGNNYTAPSVATETTATCTAIATDSDNRSTTETLALTINAVTPVLTLIDNDVSVVAAQILTLNVGHALIANDSLSATLDGEPIQLARLNDTQLAFMFPLIAPDTHSLTTVIENETVTLNFSSQDVSVPWVDSSVYINDYLQELDNSLDQLESLGGRSLDANTVNELREFINPDGEYFSSLSEQDKELLAHMIYQNVVPMMEEQSLQSKSSLQKSNSLQRNFISARTDTSCIALGFTALAIQNGTIGSIAIVVISGGTLSLPATAALAIINIANYAVIWPAAENACTRPFNTVFNNFSANLEGLDRIQKRNKIQNIQLPMKTSMNQESDVLDFFSREPKKLFAKRQYEIITGNEQDFQNIIDSFNSVGTHVRKLISYLDANPIPVIGKITVPIFLEDFFSESISFEDIRYEDINPSNLNVSAITDSGVTGGDITNIDENNSFDLKFNIEDLEVPHITFQFTITDSGHDTPLSTIIDAEVTLNPPIAYSETFAAVIGEELIARLQADFETGFKIKTQPKFGTLDTSLDSFSMPGGGLFGYTPDENITEDTTDYFTFVATNGSTTNNGESNEAKVTLEISGNPYTIEITKYSSGYEDRGTVKEILPNEPLTMPNGGKIIARLKRLGVPVSNFWSYDLPRGEFSESDVIYGDYTFNLTDTTNNVNASVPVQYTISNEAFRKVAGSTQYVDGYGYEGRTSVTFNTNGTYTATNSNGGTSTSSWVLNTDYLQWVTLDCSVYGLPDRDEPVIGQVQIYDGNHPIKIPRYANVSENGVLWSVCPSGGAGAYWWDY